MAVAFRRASSPYLLQIGVGALSRNFASSAATNLTLGVHVFHCPVLSLSLSLSIVYSRFLICLCCYESGRCGHRREAVGVHRAARRQPARRRRLRSRQQTGLLLQEDHCLVDLLHRWQEGRLPVDINCVISNHERSPNTHVIRFLERHGIPYHYLPTSSGNKREDEILDLVADTDFLVLARYMQILSGNFLGSYGRDIINIHHGLLPSFRGGSPSRQAYDAGVKLIGATTHFVTEELDAGPIIEQMVERVSHKDTLQSFVQKSENLEKQCLATAIKSYCELRVLPYISNRTVVF